MGTIATAFTSAFPDNSTISPATCRALGSTIETYLAAPYTINNNVTASPTSAPTGYIQRLIGKDADAYQMQVIDAFGGKPAVRLRRANGTAASPTAVANGDNIGEIEYTGYYTSGGSAYAAESANMRGEATQNWTSTALGSRLVFQTTPNSTASPVDVMWVGQDASLLVKGAIGYQTGIGTGGAVTQVTSRTTGVTLNKPTGAITLFTGTGAAYNTVGQSFTLTNSFIAAGDTLNLNILSATPASVQYWGNAYCASGSATITLWCYNYASTDTPIIYFTVIKGATS